MEAKGCPRVAFKSLIASAIRRKVYMSFMLRDGWSCQFREEDLKTPHPKKLNFRDVGKLFELAERGGCPMDLEARQAIEHSIEIGRGGIWLNLTAGQYGKLTQP